MAASLAPAITPAGGKACITKARKKATRKSGFQGAGSKQACRSRLLQALDHALRMHGIGDFDKARDIGPVDIAD